jgi:ATP-binding cassette subfamily A (ABC1) protein 3
MAPDFQITQDLKTLMKNNYNYETVFKNSQEEIDEYIRSDGYGEDVCLSIVFTEKENNKYSYQIGYNTTGPKERNQDDVPDPMDARSTTYLIEDISNNYNSWRKSGFILLQNWIGKRKK